MSRRHSVSLSPPVIFIGEVCNYLDALTFSYSKYLDHLRVGTELE